MRISDWSSDVCSSDLAAGIAAGGTGFRTEAWRQRGHPPRQLGLVDDQVARQVGQRHFRRRDQPKTIAAFFLNLLDKCNAVPASIFRRRQRIIFEVVVAIVSLNPILVFIPELSYIPGREQILAKFGHLADAIGGDRKSVGW